MSKTPGSDSEYDSAAYWEETAAYDYGDLNAALNALDKSDPNYNDRYTALIDRLMCADMAMGPARRAMYNREPPTEVSSVPSEDERVERLENFLRPFEKQDRETLDKWADKAKALVDGQAESVAMPLDSDDTIRIYKEAVLGQTLSIDSDAARVFRAKVDVEISEARANGMVCDIPNEIPGDENPPKQTTRDALLAHMKALGFRKASSPNGGRCVITGFPENTSRDALFKQNRDDLLTDFLGRTAGCPISHPELGLIGQSLSGNPCGRCSGYSQR